MSARQSNSVKTTATTRNGEINRALSPADLAILAAVQRFGYLTAGQVSRLLYPGCHDQNRYARRRLARLADAELLLRLTRLSTPRYGSGPQVFTLGRAGRAVLAATDSYYRPGEEQAKAHNSLFMTHTLATIDVLIAAELLGRSHPVTMPRVLTERRLRADPLRVDLPADEGRPARSVAVIPDAWFELSVNGRKPVGSAGERSGQPRRTVRVEAKHDCGAGGLAGHLAAGASHTIRFCR